MRVLLIGGDRRMIYAAEAFKEAGYEVATIGIFEGDGEVRTKADTIVLPVPATRDKVNINCALSARTIPLKTLDNLTPEASVYGGGKLGIKNYTDLLTLDEYKIKNAVLTAEGAIAFAIKNTDFSLWQSRILIVGFGKTGRALTERLKGFYADITVSARSERDFADLKSLGIKSLHTAAIGEDENRYDIVFNTVDIKFPLSSARGFKNSLFIDISSRGELEYGAAEKYKITYRKVPSLPSVFAAETAGKTIAETVINRENKNGEKYA